MESTFPIAIVPVSGPERVLPKRNSTGLFAHLADHFIPNGRNNYHPHIFSHRLTGLLAMLVIAAKVFTVGILTFGTSLPAYSAAINPPNIINLTNASRAGFGLSALTENSVLDTAAQTKANDMLAKSYFSHNTPDGKTPWDFIISAGYNYISAGENLAVNFTQAENVEDAWMNSPGHKANILNKNFQEIGVGISQGEFQGHEAIFVVQMFGTPSVQKVQLSDQPTKVAAAARPATQTPPKTGVAPGKVAVTAVKGVETPVVVPLELNDASVSVQNDTVTITAQTSASAVKVVAYFGSQGIILAPKDNTHWQGTAPLAQIAGAESNVIVKAFGISGGEVSKTVASFSTNTQENFGVAGTTPTASKAQIFGLTFDPKVLENRFYLIFIAAMLASLALAIGIKRHIQHIAVIANGSFVIILACLMFMVG